MNIMEHQTYGMFVWGMNKSSVLLRRNQKCAKYIYLLLIRHCASSSVFICLYYVTLPSGQDRERNDFTLFERSLTAVKEQKKIVRIFRIQMFVRIYYGYTIVKRQRH